MKRLSTLAALAVLLTPLVGYAAYNDATLTTATVFTVNGVTLNVYNGSAVVQSVTAGTTNLSIVLLPGSAITVKAPAGNQLSQSGGSAYLTVNECDNSASQVGFSYPVGAGSSATVTVTPSTTLGCGGGGGGGGTVTGGSGGGGAVAPAPAVTPASSTPVSTPAPANGAASSGLSDAQIQSILGVLASFNADAATIVNVKNSLSGAPKTGSVVSTAVHIFKANLTAGSLGSEVKLLQQFLNAHGYPIAAAGSGSPGLETTQFGPATRAALMKYQKAKGITPASGFFGPVTRAAVNADQSK